jgi:6-phosphogluconolactonase (cycloisomerase 2 family)
MPLPRLVRHLAAASLLVFPVASFAQSDVPSDAISAGPRAQFLYAATSDVSAVLEFGIGANGSLTGPNYFSVPNSFPEMVVADPAGKFLFVIEPQGILAFTINSQTGSLTQVTGSPFPTGGYGDYPTAIGIDPGGNFVYVSIFDRESPFLQAYRINRSTGVLTPNDLTTGLDLGSQPEPSSIQTDSTGKFVYLVDPVSGAIAGYRVNLKNGDLGRPLFPTPFAAGLGASVISTSADFLYVFARDQVRDLVGYNIDHKSGELRPVPGTFFTSKGGSSNYITLDPVHNVLYQPTFAGSIGVYRLAKNGSVHFQNFTAVGDVIAAETLLVDASGTLLFAVGASASYEKAPPLVTSFLIDPNTGNLTLAGQSQTFNSLNYYSSLAAAP